MMPDFGIDSKSHFKYNANDFEGFFLVLDQFMDTFGII